MPPIKTKKFTIFQGGVRDHFLFGRSYDATYLRQVFNKELQPFANTFFPGLILQDDAGNLYKPKVIVAFIEHTPEGSDVE